MNVITDAPTYDSSNPDWTLQQDRARLLAMGRDDRARQGQTHDHGRLLVEIFERQLWTRDEGGPHAPTRKNFVAWVKNVSGTPGSESTLLRRMDLAVVFSRAEFDELLGQGRSVSALMEIAQAPAAGRQVLLDLGPECTVDDIREAGKLLRRTLREAAEAADPECVAAKLALAVARGRAERARQRVRGELCAGCGQRLTAPGARAETGVRADGASPAAVARCATDLAGAADSGSAGRGGTRGAAADTTTGGATSAPGATAGTAPGAAGAAADRATGRSTAAAGRTSTAGAAADGALCGAGGTATGSADTATGAGGTATAAIDLHRTAEAARLAAERDIVRAGVAIHEGSSNSPLESGAGGAGAGGIAEDSALESSAGGAGGAADDSTLESGAGGAAAGGVGAAAKTSDISRDGRAAGAGAAATGTCSGGSPGAADGEQSTDAVAGSASVESGAGAAAATESACAEGWWVPLTRALTADLSAEQATELERQLVLALSGTAPATLAGLLRELAARPPGLSPALQADFADWLRGALDRDLAARWSYLYCFFLTAQLPNFRQHLHLLRGVNLPEAAAAEVKLGCAACPLTDEPPIDIPDDADDLTARAVVLAHELTQVAREGNAFLAADTGCSVATLGRLWCVAADLADDLAGLESDLAAIRS